MKILSLFTYPDVQYLYYLRSSIKHFACSRCFFQIMKSYCDQRMLKKKSKSFEVMHNFV